MLDLVPEDEMASKPARNYIAKAVPARDGGFFAQWAAPGLIPDYVRDYSPPRRQDPPPLIFPQEIDAEYAALRTMRDALNKRGRSGSGTKRDVTFDKMTGDELAITIAEAGLDFTKTAELLGYTTEVLNDMVNGYKPVPFILHWAIPLLARHDNLSFAEQIASANMQRSDRFMERARASGATDNLAGRVNPRRGS